MEISYNSHNFPIHMGANFRGINQLQFTVQELMWSAITVGRANFMDVISHGVYSEYEILYRASILVANIAQNGTTLVKSSAYVSLDPSEKSAVSYFLGLTFTKLLSSKLLAMPWLLHIDVYRNQFARTGNASGYGSSRSRPDLIGLDRRRRWIVMESKGRTNKMENTLLAAAKTQTQNLRRIGIDFPSLRIAVVTHFINGELIVDWQDPEGYNELHFDIETTREEYMSLYYRQVFNVLQQNTRTEFEDFYTYTFEAVQLTIGLDKNIYRAYESNQLENILPAKNISYEQFSTVASQNFYAGPDGILVGLGNNWRDLIRSNPKFDE